MWKVTLLKLQLLSGQIQDNASISVTTDIKGDWSKTSAIKFIPISENCPEKKFERALLSIKNCPILCAFVDYAH